MKVRKRNTFPLAVVAGFAFASPTPELRAEAGGGYGGGYDDGGIPQVASRYVTRLQERVAKADEAALRGSQLLADGDYEGAIAEFRAAIDLLPDAPITRDRREAYIKQYANASVKLAQQRADEAEYEQARELLENVLAPDIDPDNVEAKRLLEKLNDPLWYSPAVTPEHLDNVRKVELALQTAQGYVEIGDFDNAEKEYFKVLNIDNYNKAARFGMEDVERERMDYYEQAYNHTRAEFIRRIAAAWESPVPATITADGILTDTVGDTSTDRIAEIENKLKTIIIPSVEFVSTPLSDAIDFLRSRAQELDPNPDPTQRGVDIIIAAGGGGGAVAPAAPAPPAGGGGDLGFDTGGGGGAPAPAPGGFGGGGVESTPITLQLSNVPLVEALRYTLALANLKYKVEPNAVVVVPISTPDQELYTNTYVVPPNFLTLGGGGDGGGGAAAPVDPFAAAPAAGQGAAPVVRKNAKEVLESYGIVFGNGASATFNPQTSQLIVRQTQDQMELVEAVIASIGESSQKQIFITSKFVEISEEVGKELGFDWLLGAFNVGTSGVFAGGGTSGFTDAVSGENFTFVQPGATSPVGSNPVTAGLRSGQQAINSDSIDGLIAEAVGASSTSTNPVSPAVFGIAGVFTDPQFQVMIRALNAHKGVDLLSAPSVLARSGQRAKIEVIREFIYPTEYDPPEIPTNFGGGNAGGVGGNTTIAVFPVTPATPAAFETRNTGVTLEVDPVIGGDEFTIDLNLAPEVVEFEGFINYGSPINTINPNPLAGLAGGPAQVTLTENEILMPVFSTRKVTTQVTIWDGQTVALGGLIREDIQDVQDKVPVIGDLPVIGRLFRSDVELHLKRNLTIFVTAELVDPAGRPFRENQL